MTAEANISESIIFARLLLARFDASADTAKKMAEEEAAYAAAASEYGGGAAGASLSGTRAQRSTADFFHSALAAIEAGQVAAAELTAPKLVGSRRGHTALSLQSDALMLVALAAHYQRGECDNPFLTGVQKLGPQNVRELQVLARAVHGGMRRWLASVVFALAEHEEAQAGWGTGSGLASHIRRAPESQRPPVVHQEPRPVLLCARRRPRRLFYGNLCALSRRLFWAEQAALRRCWRAWTRTWEWRVAVRSRCSRRERRAISRRCRRCGCRRCPTSRGHLRG